MPSRWWTDRPTSRRGRGAAAPPISRFWWGGARVTPEPGRTGVSASRARKAEDGGAQLMVFGGRAVVEAAEGRVDVPAGMGTAVPAGGPPAPPEKLLPAPNLLRPRPNAHISWSNPSLVWAEVEGAARYTVEVCRDAGCGALVDRAVGIDTTSWRPAGLPEGKGYWRVTAAAASGLDGYPSRTRLLEIGGAGHDREPPVVVVAPGTGSRVVEGRIVARSAASLDLEAYDDASGVATIEIRWDGGAWREVTGSGVSVPDSGGVHTLAVRGSDRAGRLSPEWTIAVEVDADPPQPPRPDGMRSGGSR